jgi:hypothetical protein
MSFETCHHVKEDGVYCASPALRGRKYCYSHLMQRGRRLRRALAQSRNEPCPLNLPSLEDLGSVRIALSEIVQALATGQLEHRTAGLTLYAIQQATTVSLRMAQMEAALEGAEEHTEELAVSAVQAFDLFLTADRVLDVLILLEIHQAIDLVSLGEAYDCAALVLRNTPLDAVGDTGVNAARLACHDVHVEVPFSGHAAHLHCDVKATGYTS